jgi:hypothetical protein
MGAGIGFWGNDPNLPRTPQEAWAWEWRRLALDWRRWGIRGRMAALDRAVLEVAVKLGTSGPPPIDFIRAGVIPDNAELDAALATTAEVAGSWLGPRARLADGDGGAQVDRLLLEGYLTADRKRLGHPLDYDVWLWGAECSARYRRAWLQARHERNVEREFILWGIVNSCISTLFEDDLGNGERSERPVGVRFDGALASGQLDSGRRRVSLPRSLCDGSLVGATAEVLRVLAGGAVERHADWAHWAVAMAQAGFTWASGTQRDGS